MHAHFVLADIFMFGVEGGFGDIEEGVDDGPFARMFIAKDD